MALVVVAAERGPACPKPTGYVQTLLPLSKNQVDKVSDMVNDSDIIFVQESHMSRVFAYCRVSTTGQATENQVQEIRGAGFSVDGRRIVEETISGSTPAGQRPGFCKLTDRMEAGDVLVVTKLDRLGRNAMDVRSTVEALSHVGVRVHCLALGGIDLTSAAGKMTMQVLAAVAEFERDLLIERTNAGLARAKAEGKAIGRPASLSAAQLRAVRAKLAKGQSVSSLARELKTSRQTIMRARDATIDFAQSKQA